MAIQDYDPSSYQKLSMAPAPRAVIRSDIGATASVQYMPDHGSIFDEPISSHQQSRVHSSDVATWSTAGNSQSRSVNTVNASELGNRSGIFETALDASGSPIARGNLKPTDTLAYGNMRSSVESLQAAGLLYQSEDGRYQWADGGHTEYRGLDWQRTPEPVTEQRYQQQSQQQPESNTSEYELPGLSHEDQQQVEHFKRLADDGFAMANPQDELALSKTIAPVPQPIFDAAMNKAIEGGLQAVNWDEVARSSGISVEEARERGSIAHSIMVGHADRITKQQGISDPREFYQWLATKDPEAFSRSQRELFGSRRSNTLKAATKEYLRSISPSEADYRSSGYNTKRSGSGGLMIQVDGAWYASEALVKGGYLKTY